MDFEFDPLKDEANLVKHGIGFVEAQELWEVLNVVFPAARVSGEERWGIVGMLRGQLYVAIFAPRGARVRLISCHRADAKWEQIYERKASH
jgi:uncharacterized DUF497 family protein